MKLLAKLALSTLLVLVVACGPGNSPGKVMEVRLTRELTSGAIGTAALSWVAPTTNADGSTLTDLAGFILKYGTSPGVYSVSVPVPDPKATMYIIKGLPRGHYYFVVLAMDTGGNESEPSYEVNKIIN